MRLTKCLTNYNNEYEVQDYLDQLKTNMKTKINMTPEQLDELSDMIAKKVLDNLHFNFIQDPNINVMPAEEFLHKDVDAFGNAKYSMKDTLAAQLTELMLTKEKLIQEEKYELLQELQEIYDKIKADYDKL